jgi:hypothetical protein
VPRGSAAAREWGKRRGFTGGRFPYLPWAVVARGGGSLGGGGPEDGGLGGGAVLWCSIKGRRWPWWCVAVRGAADPFYRWRKAVRPGIFLSSGSFDGPAMAVERENIPPLTPSGEAAAGIRGGAVNAVLWDGIGRPVTRCGRRRSRRCCSVDAMVRAGGLRLSGAARLDRGFCRRAGLAGVRRRRPG